MGPSLVMFEGGVAAAGPQLEAEFGPPARPGKVLVLCHYDTVWPAGTVAERPFVIQGDVARGPGVLVMRGGIVANAIGYDTVDAGTLAPGDRRFQFGTRAFVAPYGMSSDQRGTPADAAAVRAALGA